MHFKQIGQVRIPQTIKNPKPSSESGVNKDNKLKVKDNKKELEPKVKKDLGYINCTIEDVDKSAPIESRTEFSILARPYIKDSDMHTGDVTITISRYGNIIESTYTIYYFLNGGWKAVIHKRLGAPLTMADAIEELCWILPSHIDDTIDEETDKYLAFNTHLAEEFTKRIKYFSRHVKLTQRYSIARTLILGDVN